MTTPSGAPAGDHHGARTRTIRLTGLFTLRAPLSHIGESISTTTYLNQEVILQPDGAPAEVFVYNGNAWRGQLRDLAAAYMLARIGDPRLPLDAFHLLFSGGRIGGEQSVNIERARMYRRAIPMTALWGGGVGNQILPGKLKVHNSYPLCREALPVLFRLPAELRARAERLSYRGMTFEKSFSRKDDGKDDRLRVHLLGAEQDGQAAPAALLPGAAKAKPEREGPADQMRMTSELLAAGVQLGTVITAEHVTDVELGCLVSAIHQFADAPYIGGQSNRGHGYVSLDYDYHDTATGERGQFLSVDGETALLAPIAAEAKDSYDSYLRGQYDALLARQGTHMAGLLAGAAG